MDDEYMKLVNTKGKIHPSIKEVCKIVSVISSLHLSSNYIDESDDNNNINDDDVTESDFTIDLFDQEDDPL